MADVIEKKPRIVGVAGTFLFWLLFLVITTAFSLFTRKPVYKSVQIRLDSAQAQEARAAAAPKANTAASENAKAAPPPPAPAPQTASAQAKNSSSKAVQKTSTKAASSTAKTPQKPAATTKSASTKPAPTKTPVEEAFEPEFFDPMEQFAKNTAKTKAKKTAADIDWDSIEANSSSTSPSARSAPATVKEVSSLSGSAASAATGTTSALATSTAKDSASTAASSGTSAALGNIASQSKVNGSGLSSTSTDTSNRQTNGNSDIRFTSGAGRQLLSDPKISLSPAAQKVLSGQAEMQITFTVRADGTVTDVTIPSYLPQTVRQEISLQISRWRFSSASGNDTAIFNYRIKE